MTARDTFSPVELVDPRARAAAERVTLERVGDQGFDAAYDLLEGYFGPRNELEARGPLRSALAAPWRHRSIVCRYHVVVARDRRGEVLGVGDMFCSVDHERRLGVLRYSNFLVLPAARGSGVASLLDEGSEALLRASLLSEGLAPETPSLVTSDIEPIDPTDLETWHRLRLWSRRGYRAVPYTAYPLRFLGPADPRDPTRQTTLATTFAVVRAPAWRPQMRVIRRAELLALVDADEASDLALFAADEVYASAARTRAAIVAAADPVELLPLPGEARTLSALVPLLSRQASGGGAGDSASELAALLARHGWG
ncbi:MAG: hypothetical protein JNL82_09885 [Myxococcales bacterium]|nr:hypothetical protein [Myxococcales bacterium]